MGNGTGGFLNPQNVLNQIDVHANFRIADFGCGHGYFAIPLAKMVGAEGRIYAIDILEDALAEVKSKAGQVNLSNIDYIRGNLEVPGGSKVADNCCDMVLLANILFESQKKSDIIKEARRVLKLGGLLVIIDWQPIGNKLTSDSGWRISEEEAKRMAQEQSFAPERDFEAGNYHYGIIFRKF